MGITYRVGQKKCFVTQVSGVKLSMQHFVLICYSCGIFPRAGNILEQSAVVLQQTRDKKVNLKSSDFEERRRRRRRKIYRSSRSSQQLSQATKKKEEESERRESNPREPIQRSPPPPPTLHLRIHCARKSGSGIQFLIEKTQFLIAPRRSLTVTSQTN